MAEKKGLTSAEVAARLAQDGHNTLSAKQKSRLGAIILEQFKDYMVLVLIGAAIVSAPASSVTKLRPGIDVVIWMTAADRMPKMAAWAKLACVSAMARA